VRQSAPLRQYTAANQEWALDFPHDPVAAGRAIRILSVIETQECLALKVDQLRQPARDVGCSIR
jgi:hypothetical protein